MKTKIMIAKSGIRKIHATIDNWPKMQKDAPLRSEAIRLVELARAEGEKNARNQMTRGHARWKVSTLRVGRQAKHGALLTEIEMALDRDRNNIEVLTPERAELYLEKMEAVMAGEIGDREWRLHEGLAAKRRK